MALFLGLGISTASAALAQSEEGPSWYPSRYGADDRLGAINELSPAKVVAAAKLVKTGKSYGLGVVTGPNTPAYGTRKYQIATMTSGNGSGDVMGTNRASGNDDLLITWLGIGSQLDGLGHLGIDYRYYNGVPAADFLRPDGLIQFGLHAIPPIVTRGVLFDVAGHRGVPVLEPGTAINGPELEAIAKKKRISVERGDVVLFHTGWLNVADTDKARFLAAEPGLGKQGAEWLASKGVVAVGSDSWGVEAQPFEVEGEMFPVHQILLAKSGVYILENMDTRALAKDGATEFLFVLGAPRFQGAVQLVINPVAIR